MEFIERYIKLFGIQIIEYILADSEYIAKKWIGSFNKTKFATTLEYEKIFG